MSQKKFPADWSAVDWSLQSMTIAQRLGCSHTTVNKYRRLHAPGTCRKRIPWETVKDWNRRNDVIAAELGTTAMAVTVHRCNHGIPPGPRKPGSGLHKKRKPGNV